MNYLARLRRVRKTPLSVIFRHAKNLLHTQLLRLHPPQLSKELIPSPPKNPAFPLALFRSWIHASKEIADRLSAHEFDLLGSSLTHLGKNINWQKPFAGNDPKLAWELSRFQFLPTLCRAYEIHKDEKYATEAQNLIHDWIIKNPIGKGINWRIAMEVAIRACNFTLGWYFLKDSAAWKDTKWHNEFLTSILTHGKFIYRNLEYGPGFNSNHFLADITGLLVLGVLFPQFREAKKWKHKAMIKLEKAMQDQVYEDGVYFEASIPYHRLACELFGYSAMLCKTNDIPVSQEFLGRLEKMFEFVWYYTKPNGLAPQIGDNDDGRLFIFEDFYSWERRDHTHLKKLAAELFSENAKFTSHNIEKTSLGFNFAGIYIMRKNDFYCIVDAGSNGQNGWGGHAHNDTLSFELSVGGEDFIIDPGTYVYTGDPISRNHFRSTAMHNTVMIDGEEINRFMKAEVFRIYYDAIPQVNRWDPNEMHDFLDAQHSGYERLKQPVTHRRTFHFDKKNLSLEICDYFLGKGSHTLQWNFHFAQEVEVKKTESGIIAEKNGVRLEMKMPPELVQNIDIREGEISHRYGVKEKGKVVKISLNLKLDRQSFRFLFKMVISEASSN